MSFTRYWLLDNEIFTIDKNYKNFAVSLLFDEHVVGSQVAKKFLVNRGRRKKSKFAENYFHLCKYTARVRFATTKMKNNFEILNRKL